MNKSNRPHQQLAAEAYLAKHFDAAQIAEFAETLSMMIGIYQRVDRSQDYDAMMDLVLSRYSHEEATVTQGVASVLLDHFGEGIPADLLPDADDLSLFVGSLMGMLMLVRNAVIPADQQSDDEIQAVTLVALSAFDDRDARLERYSQIARRVVPFVQTLADATNN